MALDLQQPGPDQLPPNLTPPSGPAQADLSLSLPQSLSSSSLESLESYRSAGSLATLDSLPHTTDTTNTAAFASPESDRVDTGCPSVSSHSHHLSSPPSLESGRRLSARPSPLTLDSSNKEDNRHERAHHGHYHYRQQFLPRTSSLNSLPNVAAITAVVTASGNSQRTHSLSSQLDKPCLDLPARPTPSGPFPGPAGLLGRPIRRKPIASTASPLVEQRPYSFQERPPIKEEDEEEIEEEDAEESEEEGSDHDELQFLNSLDDLSELPRPDQRFTRSCSIDSPTLYEFPGQSQRTHVKPPPPPLQTSVLVPASLSVSKQSDSTDKGLPFAVSNLASPKSRDIDSEEEEGEQEQEEAALTPRKNPASTPAAPQTDITEVSAQHEKGPVTNADRDQICVRDPAEEEQEAVEPKLLQEQNDEVEEDHHISPNLTMSLFSRKTSPPHLSLGTVSNHSDSKENKDINDIKDAQKSPSGDSLYSAYQDNEQSPAAQTNNTLTPTNTSQPNKPNTLKPLPKSPASSKLGNFFGWSPSPSTTEFSDREYSPLPSPYSLQPPSTVVTHASTLSTTETSISSSSQGGDYKRNSRNNAFGSETHAVGDDLSGYKDNLQTPAVITSQSQHLLPPLSPSGEIEEMEDELKAISAELASSIRREIDLEDLVDRLQSEISNAQVPGRRTSDYYSDSGYSSSRAPSDYDAAKEEIAQVQRRAEQEKAQVRLELTQKLSDERTRRTFLDQQIKELSERAATLDLAQTQRSNEDVSGRVKQLENACEDLRRRLSEERGVKENFEDLLSAMKSELQNATNERDNLRDEVVPQLRARVEGLESQASELARQTYETSKMQQELQTLKEENSNLRSIGASLAAVAEDGGELQQEGGFKLQRPPTTLSRSNTVKRQQQQQQQQQGPQQGPGATAPSSTLNESREVLAERLRDVEAQRDALHNALKNLLDRQEFQNRENSKKVRALEVERDRLLTASPKKAGYERDVANLREEVNQLRRRAEDALEQKWQVEKGLSGLKMDLDRAEEEIASLRKLLQQSNILATPSSRVVSVASSIDGSIDGGGNAGAAGPAASSASLETAYRNLQESYSEALKRIQELEISSPDGTTVAAVSDEATAMAMRRLEQALAGAEADRDAAQSQLADAATAEASLLESERSLAEQLEASAERVTELAQQVQTQLAANAVLRERLSAMVARRETEQRFNKERIVGLEARLRTLEEQLVTTQTAAEDGVARHEEQVAALREAHSAQLQRLRDASGQLRAPPPSPRGGGAAGSSPSPGLSPRAFTAGSGGGLRSPMSPMFAINGRLVPSRPSSRGSSVGAGGMGIGGRSSPSVDADQQVQMSTLRARVSELEGALASADSELQEVVGRMNTAQIEVLQLQEEREQAARETRQLQRQLEAEQLKNFEERFRMLGRSATVA